MISTIQIDNDKRAEALIEYGHYLNEFQKVMLRDENKFFVLIINHHQIYAILRPV